ncbi:MAG: hypothetical protein AAFP80_10025 [Pseudomonadota bacterium]
MKRLRAYIKSFYSTRIPASNLLLFVGGIRFEFEPASNYYGMAQAEHKLWL